MKLRNKKTKEIGNLKPCFNDEKIAVWVENKSSPEYRYNSLAELSAEWEDYKEPFSTSFYTIVDGKIKYCISYSKRVAGCPDDAWAYFGDYGRESIKQLKEVGLYFETKEEAEQAVEKLKAVKRLRDKGFEFDVIPALGHCDDKKFDISIIATMPAKWWYNDKVVDDIHYVFGGEE